ncbi:MAG: CDGSH iron-sulfur domain-containing protein [Bauldia sp.]|nr:CDGSH iron-sulfur domain-containing protein [Bauldia sp.]
MAQEEPKIRIESREELIYLLAEAAAIEHNLMCCYLYAAWSLKRGERDGLSKQEAEAVTRWKRAIISVAIEEMAHLALVSNLSTSIGGAPHFSRPNFPIAPGYHPSGVVVELARFSPAVLDHFIFLERPEGKELSDSTEFVHPADYHRTQPKARLMPHAQDYATVGHLYRGVRHGLEVLAHHIGEQPLFCGDPPSQLGPSEASLPGLALVTNLASATAAIQTIIEQGEGAPEHSEDSHFSRFMRVRKEYGEFLAADPAFEPAFPVAHNPVMRQPLDPHNRVFIDAPETVHVLDFANALYGHTLRCLVQAYGRGAGEEADKRLFVDTAIDMMEALTQVGPYLASLPASKSHPGVNAGVTFTMLRDVAKLPRGGGEKRIMAERVAELSKHARHLFPEGHELAGLCGSLDTIMRKFGVSDLRTVGKVHTGAAPAAEAAARAPKPDDLPSGAGGKVEIAEGRDLTVRFEGKRCVHARFCVLGAPAVFKANTPGEWIFPDAMATEAVVRIAHACPSGAIRYTRKGGGPQEEPPPVNVAGIRENGPYAFRARLSLDGVDIGFRATLCRCGASKNKPFCDGSHNALGFKATGEPDTRPSEPLAARDGPLVIDPEKNGPLRVSGNLEICSGTGRTIDRVTKARLCRCGGSRSKPFCDNTHLKIGFQADGN